MFSLIPKEKYKISLIIDEFKLRRRVDNKLTDDIMRSYLNSIKYIEVIDLKEIDDGRSVDYLADIYVYVDKLKEDYKGSTIGSLFKMFDDLQAQGVILNSAEKI